MTAELGVEMVKIARIIRSYRLPSSQEQEYQAAIERILRDHQIPFEPQVDLGDGRGRIDIKVSAPLNIGVELKTKGSPAAVTRQLLRYATSPALDGLILITARIKLSELPGSLNGKPLVVVSTWRSGL